MYIYVQYFKPNPVLLTSFLITFTLNSHYWYSVLIDIRLQQEIVEKRSYLSALKMTLFSSGLKLAASVAHTTILTGDPISTAFIPCDKYTE